MVKHEHLNYKNRYIDNSSNVEKNMKKLVLFLMFFVGMYFGLCLPANAYYGPVAGISNGGGGYGGGNRSYYSGGYRGYGGYNQNYLHDNSNYRYRHVTPVTPAMTRNNTVPPQTVSCNGTASYIKIGNNVMPCKSAAATRVRYAQKARPAGKARTARVISTGNTSVAKEANSTRKMPKIHYVHQKMPKISKNTKRDAS